jgi:hypothetical protein
LADVEDEPRKKRNTRKNRSDWAGDAGTVQLKRDLPSPFMERGRG